MTTWFENPAALFVGFLLVLSSLGVILLKKPVHACLSFLLTLFCLADLYLQLSAQFIAVMQLLVYAGAILVIFMFVIVLFQDAHNQIVNYKTQCATAFLIAAGAGFLVALGLLARQFIDLPTAKQPLPEGFGTVQALGKALYLEYFFPFEAITLLFLIAVIGSLYIARKEVSTKG